MNKQELINRLDKDTYGYWCLLQANGLTEEDAADVLYNEGYVCYWERDLLKGDTVPYYEFTEKYNIPYGNLSKLRDLWEEIVEYTCDENDVEYDLEEPFTPRMIIEKCKKWWSKCDYSKEMIEERLSLYDLILNESEALDMDIDYPFTYKELKK